MCAEQLSHRDVLVGVRVCVCVWIGLDWIGFTKDSDHDKEFHPDHLLPPNENILSRRIGHLTPPWFTGQGISAKKRVMRYAYIVERR